MGRPPQPEIREQLLASCTAWALEHGLPDGLEPLAAASGASSRMLLYHFGTRDGLLRAVLERARAQQVAAWTRLFEPRPGTPYADVLADAWATMSGPEERPFLRLFGGQLRQESEQRLWPGFQRLATTDWLEPLADGLRGIGRPDLATLVLAVLRGLLMDLHATGDAERADRAFADFLALLPTAEDAAG